MNNKDKLTYAYIKNIKKWMECPSCGEKLRFSKSRKAWICNDCGCTVTEEEFLDDFVFWFCDECGVYLNNQQGFDKNLSKHICRKCGYENDITDQNIKGTCSDCGKNLHNPDSTLCESCRQIRKEKGREWLITAGEILVNLINEYNQDETKHK